MFFRIFIGFFTKEMQSTPECCACSYYKKYKLKGSIEFSSF